MTQTREVWRVVLEKLQRGKSSQADLNYWIEESQAAQLDALASSLKLLVGVAGPVQHAIEVHRDNAALLWNSAQNARARLEEANLLLRRVESASSAVESRRAGDALRFVYDDLTKAMRSEASLAERFKRLETVADSVLKANAVIERVKDANQKHDLLLAAKILGDFAIDVVKDMLLKKLAAGPARALRLAEFGLDYGYSTGRFYLAWTSVHEILDQIDSRNELTSTLDRKITETTDQIRKLRGELRQIEEAEDDADGEALLAKFRQNDRQEAYFTGEWFSQRTGIRARGEPIVKEDR